jgi:hypothetical protein
MALASANLASALASWTVAEATFVGDFGELVAHVYENTPERSPLRALLAHFAACVVEDVVGFEGWYAMLADEPDFGADLVGYMCRRFDDKGLGGDLGT